MILTNKSYQCSIACIKANLTQFKFLTSWKVRTSYTRPYRQEYNYSVRKILTQVNKVCQRRNTYSKHLSPPPNLPHPTPESHCSVEVSNPSQEQLVNYTC